jgi:WD40 repeat protein
MSGRYADYTEYGFRHAVKHLIRSSEPRRVTKLLLDLGFVEAKVLCLKDPISIIQDYDSVIYRSISIFPPGCDLVIQRLLEMRRHIWTEASVLSKTPECVIQQLTNRLRWSSASDDYWRKQADQAVQRCLDAGHPIFRTLLPNPAPCYGTQRLTEAERGDTIGMAMIDRGLVLWSTAGDWRILDRRGSVSQKGNIPVPPMPLQQLVGDGSALVAVRGRILHHWEEWPKGKVITKTLPFVVLQVALACQGKEVVVIGHNGEWKRYSLRSEDLEECGTGQLSNKGTCCAMSSSGEHWAVGTRTGRVFFCDDIEQRVIAKHSGMIRAVAIHFEKGVLASGGQDGKLQCVNIQDGTVFRSIEHNNWINDITFSTDGEEVYWATESGDLLSLAVDSPNEDPLVWMSEDAPVERICLFPKRSNEPATVAVLASDRRARLVERPRDTVLFWHSPLSKDVNYIVPLRDGSSILALDSEDNRFVIDLDSAPPTAKRLSKPAGAVAASALLGNQLIAVYQDFGQSRVTRHNLVLQAWQTKTLWLQRLLRRTQSLVFKPRVTFAAFTHATFSPDLRTFVVVRARSASDKRIEAYDTTTSKKLFEMEWNSPDCRTMAISDKVKYILVASLLNSPPQLIVSDDPSGNTIDLPLEGCKDAAFSSDGSALLTVDRHGKAWFSQNPPHGEYLDYEGGMVCCDLSSDARWILLGSSDGQVILIDRMAASPGPTVRRAFLPWNVSYCQVYPQRRWVALGGHGNLQVLEWDQG